MTEQRLSAEQRQVLNLLASSPRGAIEALLVRAHGFEVMKTGGKTIEVVHVRIMATGRRAIERLKCHDGINHRYFLSDARPQSEMPKQ